VPILLFRARSCKNRTRKKTFLAPVYTAYGQGGGIRAAKLDTPFAVEASGYF
jgi:hypothetical protein